MSGVVLRAFTPEYALRTLQSPYSAGYTPRTRLFLTGISGPNGYHVGLDHNAYGEMIRYDNPFGGHETYDHFQYLYPAPRSGDFFSHCFNDDDKRIFVMWPDPPETPDAVDDSMPNRGVTTVRLYDGPTDGSPDVTSYQRTIPATHVNDDYASTVTVTRPDGTRVISSYMGRFNSGGGLVGGISSTAQERIGPRSGLFREEPIICRRACGG